MTDILTAPETIAFMEWGFRTLLLTLFVAIGARLLRARDPHLERALWSAAAFGAAAIAVLGAVAILRAAGATPSPSETTLIGRGLTMQVMTHPVSSRDSWPGVLGVVWMLGVAALSIRGAMRWRWTQWMLRSAESVPNTMTSVPVLRSEAIESAVVVGTLRPRIVVCAGSTSWSNDRMRQVLGHECAHISARDPVVLAVARFAATLAWWNPVAWWTLGRLRRAQELACDAAVLADGAPATDYATTILDLVRKQPTNAAWTGFGGASVAERVRAILGPQRAHASRGSLRLATFTVTFAALATALAPLHKGAAPQTFDFRELGAQTPRGGTQRIVVGRDDKGRVFARPLPARPAVPTQR